MRSIMDAFPDSWEPVHIGGKNRPNFYISQDPPNTIAVIGPYESPCGGCDAIGSARMVFDEVENIRLIPGVKHILMEGLLLSEDVKWSVQIPNLKVIFLTTPLERCLKQIGQRRKAAGNEKPLNPQNTTRRVDVIERARIRLEEAGVSCRRASADQAVNLVLSYLRGK